jgi:hypothetical protein
MTRTFLAKKASGQREIKRANQPFESGTCCDIRIVAAIVGPNVRFNEGLLDYDSASQDTTPRCHAQRSAIAPSGGSSRVHAMSKLEQSRNDLRSCTQDRNAVVQIVVSDRGGKRSRQRGTIKIMKSDVLR